MHMRTLLVLLVFGVMVVFAAANWNAFMAPTTLSFLFASIEAPLGLIMLGFSAILTGVFLVFIAYLQASLLIDTRRHTRELQAQRTLADQAEASRLAELRAYLEAGLPKMEMEIAESKAALEARLDRLDRELRTVVEQAGNSLAASIGELEDHIDQGKSVKDTPAPV